MRILTILIVGTVLAMLGLGAVSNWPATKELILDMICLAIAAAILGGVFRCIIGAMDRAQERRWFQHRNPDFDENRNNQRKEP